MEYKKSLSDKMQKFLARIRWNMFWYKNPDKMKQKLETFGFTSTNYPPTNRELREFEADMMDLINKIEMKN